jgi:hypothetical protein
MPRCYHFCYRSSSLRRHSSGRPLPFGLRPILTATRSAARRTARVPFLRSRRPRGYAHNRISPVLAVPAAHKARLTPLCAQPPSRIVMRTIPQALGVFLGPCAFWAGLIRSRAAHTSNSPYWCRMALVRSMATEVFGKLRCESVPRSFFHAPMSAGDTRSPAGKLCRWVFRAANLFPPRPPQLLFQLSGYSIRLGSVFF